ncbi:MAG: hypothetical protein AAF603_10880 [Pseudomonadota bacterium]
MNSQTHALIAAALLGRRSFRQKDHIALLSGALIPDAFMLIFILYAGVTRLDMTTMWGVTYWQEPWQSFSTLSNSAPLYGVIFILGLWVSPLWRLFALGALLHVGVDFLTHAEDAHRHFWPLTDWRFQSPISYWDVEHFGQWVSLFEAILGVGLIILLWRQGTAKWVKVIFILAGLAYLAIPLFWVISLG